MIQLHQIRKSIAASLIVVLSGCGVFFDDAPTTQFDGRFNWIKSNPKDVEQPEGEFWRAKVTIDWPDDAVNPVISGAQVSSGLVTTSIVPGSHYRVKVFNDKDEVLRTLRFNEPELIAETFDDGSIARDTTDIPVRRRVSLNLALTEVPSYVELMAGNDKKPLARKDFSIVDVRHDPDIPAFSLGGVIERKVQSFGGEDGYIDIALFPLGFPSSKLDSFHEMAREVTNYFSQLEPFKSHMDRIRIHKIAESNKIQCDTYGEPNLGNCPTGEIEDKFEQATGVRPDILHLFFNRLSGGCGFRGNGTIAMGVSMMTWSVSCAYTDGRGPATTARIAMHEIGHNFYLNDVYTTTNASGWSWSVTPDSLMGCLSHPLPAPELSFRMGNNSFSDLKSGCRAKDWLGLEKDKGRSALTVMKSTSSSDVYYTSIERSYIQERFGRAMRDRIPRDPVGIEIEPIRNNRFRIKLPKTTDFPRYRIAIATANYYYSSDVVPPYGGSSRDQVLLEYVDASATGEYVTKSFPTLSNPSGNRYKKGYFAEICPHNDYGTSESCYNSSVLPLVSIDAPPISRHFVSDEPINSAGTTRTFMSIEIDTTNTNLFVHQAQHTLSSLGHYIPIKFREEPSGDWVECEKGTNGCQPHGFKFIENGKKRVLIRLDDVSFIQNQTPLARISGRREILGELKFRFTFVQKTGGSEVFSEFSSPYIVTDGTINTPPTTGTESWRVNVPPDEYGPHGEIVGDKLRLKVYLRDIIASAVETVEVEYAALNQSKRLNNSQLDALVLARASAMAAHYKDITTSNAILPSSSHLGEYFSTYSGDFESSMKIATINLAHESVSLDGDYLIFDVPLNGISDAKNLHYRVYYRNKVGRTLIATNTGSKPLNNPISVYGHSTSIRFPADFDFSSRLYKVLLPEVKVVPYERDDFTKLSKRYELVESNLPYDRFIVYLRYDKDESTGFVSSPIILSRVKTGPPPPTPNVTFCDDDPYFLCVQGPFPTTNIVSSRFTHAQVRFTIKREDESWDEVSSFDRTITSEQVPYVYENGELRFPSSFRNSYAHYRYQPATVYQVRASFMRYEDEASPISEPVSLLAKYWKPYPPSSVRKSGFVNGEPPQLVVQWSGGPYAESHIIKKRIGQGDGPGWETVAEVPKDRSDFAIPLNAEESALRENGGFITIGVYSSNPDYNGNDYPEHGEFLTLELTSKLEDMAGSVTFKTTEDGYFAEFNCNLRDRNSSAVFEKSFDGTTWSEVHKPAYLGLRCKHQDRIDSSQPYVYFRYYYTNPAGISSDYSAVQKFAVPPASIAKKVISTYDKSNHSVVLNWESVPAAGAYEVLRRTDTDTDWDGLATEPVATVTQSRFVDRLPNELTGMHIRYNIRPVRDDLKAPVHERTAAKIAIPEFVPGNLTADVRSGEIGLRWDSVAYQPEKEVLLEGRVNGGAWQHIASTVMGAGGYVFRSPEHRTTYQFRYRINTAGFETPFIESDEVLFLDPVQAHWQEASTVFKTKAGISAFDIARISTGYYLASAYFDNGTIGFYQEKMARWVQSGGATRISDPTPNEVRLLTTPDGGTMAVFTSYKDGFCTIGSNKFDAATSKWAKPRLLTQTRTKGLCSRIKVFSAPSQTSVQWLAHNGAQFTLYNMKIGSDAVLSIDKVFNAPEILDYTVGHDNAEQENIYAAYWRDDDGLHLNVVSSSDIKSAKFDLDDEIFSLRIVTDPKPLGVIWGANSDGKLVRRFAALGVDATRFKELLGQPTDELDHFVDHWVTSTAGVRTDAFVALGADASGGFHINRIRYSCDVAACFSQHEQVYPHRFERPVEIVASVDLTVQKQKHIHLVHEQDSGTIIETLTASIGTSEYSADNHKDLLDPNSQLSGLPVVVVSPEGWQAIAAASREKDGGFQVRIKKFE